jgi:hypothetical protein
LQHECIRTARPGIFVGEDFMNYLAPSEYEEYALEGTTPAAWIGAASGIMDGYCRRATLAVAQYEERLRLASGRNTIRLTYLPLVAVTPASSPIVTLRGRYAIPRRGEWPWGDLPADVSVAFGLPGTWSDIDPASADVSGETGEISLPVNALGLGYTEIEVTYTAGLEPLPHAVKVACAQIVRNAQATPALNVRSSRVDRLQLEYFSEGLLDETVRSLLAPYVAQKVG